jgi:hypothetical protein
VIFEALQKPFRCLGQRILVIAAEKSKSKVFVKFYKLSLMEDVFSSPWFIFSIILNVNKTI